MMLTVVALTGCSSGGDDTPVVPTVPDTPAEFTARGWQYFESNNYSDALDDFNSALALLPDYGQALSGRGWCELKLAVDSAGLTASVAAFTAAMMVDEDTSEVFAGRASALLALGGDNLDVASSNAYGVAMNDPSFVFSHQQSIDTKDMFLISAFAEAGMGDFNSALYQADLIEVSGIEADYPETWLVAGTSYSSFNASVLARLHQLSEQYSG